MIYEIEWIIAKIIPERSIITSITPKFDNGFFVDLRVLDKYRTWNFPASSSSQYENNFLFAIRTKHVNEKSRQILA